MRFGVHCTVRNGFEAALDETVELNCNTLQIFTQSPRGWRTRTFQPEEFTRFKKKRRQLNIDPVVIHSPYLPNLCTSDKKLYERSKELLAKDLKRSTELGAEYLVIHPGAYSPDSSAQEGMERCIAAMNEVIAKDPGQTVVLIENMAGGGRRLGGRFSEIGALCNGMKNQERVGVCLDTCHTYGAGYDIRTDDTIQKTLNEFEKEVGLKRIKVVHVNDSKGELGCQRDLHENLGAGHIGMNGFKSLFKQPAFKNCAFILETPRRPYPDSDLNNIKKLKECLL